MKKYIVMNITALDLCDCDKAASFLQSGFWGVFKSAFGWKALAFRTSWQSGETEQEKTLLVLWRHLGPGLSLAYVPWGPELPDQITQGEYSAALTELAVKLKAFLPASTGFIRFDPPCSVRTNTLIPPWHGVSRHNSYIAKPFVHAAADIQPPDTVIINLENSPEEILAQMKSKWRYNIRLGGKKLVIKRADEAGIETFYELFRETAARDGIALHGIQYYKKLFALAADYAKMNNPPAQKPDLRLYLAEYENKAIAGIITLFFGDTGTYLYGASSNQYRNMMAPYALQWQAMQDAKNAGCKEYDLFGIPPDDNPAHPMAGLYRFKTGFGGLIIHRPGSFDYPYKPFIYVLFRFAEKIRKSFRDLKKKR